MKIFFLLLVMACNVNAETIEFRIPKGTGAGAWNTPENPIVAKVGDSILFINEDTIEHQLHTNGAPCSHGERMAPQKTWICEAKRPFSSEESGALYDHQFGQEAAVWFEVSE